ncbi:S53 family peptidase [Actinomycetospora endophytica]|uniref:S53 family peptidase n=1 Tax=Actinomycetospora endophytica TaxID=2291215 RepID=A0ABS8PCW2_9PSEU|nr:S53 family peptidase [Actinomycetospora endophytica]MCD2196120.1 S53 family peptidase [Actinomycetospora endophytica]
MTTVPGTDKPMKPGVEKIADVNPDLPVEITLTLRGPDLPSGATATEGAMDPADFRKDYGASQQDIDTVTAALSRLGLTVRDSSRTARSVSVEGPAKVVEKAFGVHLGTYRGPAEEYRGQEGPVQVPAELATIVTGVFGLDLRRVAHRLTAAPEAPPSGTALSPRQLEDRYDFPSGDASGQTIAVLEFFGGYFAEDLAQFCRKYRLPDATASLTTVSIDQQPIPTLAEIKQLPTSKQGEWIGASGEVMMDVEIVAGLAPGAEIAVYFAPFTQKGWVDILNRLLHDRPAVVSVSWGTREDDPTAFSTAAVTAIEQRLAALAALGVTVCVSSGDDGSGDNGNDGRCHVNYPASSASVLAVGGTEIKNGAEVAWLDSPGTRFDPAGNPTGGGATGGGISTVIPRPSWQQQVSVSRPDDGSDFDGRVVPDVAALASRPFYDLIMEGRDAPNGGTSASAPLWASLIARCYATLGPQQKPVFATPRLYEGDGLPAFRDITDGTNTSTPDPGVGYEAGKGYDAVTGWGVPVGINLPPVLRSS